MSNMSYQTKRNILLGVTSALVTPHVLPVLCTIAFLTTLFICGMLITAAVCHEWQNICKLADWLGWQMRNLWVELNPWTGSFWIVGVGGLILSHIEKPINRQHYIQ